mgnify:CR=1 FL=1
MNPSQTLTPLESWRWVNLVGASPLFGQQSYSLMPVDALVVLGINSPPLMETLKNVSQQFTRFTFRT